MERYLLFDSGCTRCSRIAKAVEEEARGWFTVRSLREQSVQAQLAAADPHWVFQPTLMEVEGDQVRLFTGMRMRWKLLAGLGLHRAMRVAGIVLHAPAPASGVDQTRRDLVRNGGALIGGLALFGVGGALKPARAAAGKTTARRSQAAAFSGQPVRTDQQMPPAPLTLAEAAMARQIFLQAPDLQTFAWFNQRQGRSLATHTQGLTEIPAGATTPNGFQSDGQVVYLVGEQGGMRSVKVALGVVGHAAYVSGHVDLITGQVALVTQTDIVGSMTSGTIRILSPDGKVAIHSVEQDVVTQLYNNLGETECPEKMLCHLAVEMPCALEAMFLCMLLPEPLQERCHIAAHIACRELAERICHDACRSGSCDEIPNPAPGGGTCEDCEAVSCNACCLLCVTAGGWWCASSGAMCDCHG